eukprot:9367480-Pyramimonas_sp.AAC.1
MPAHFYKNVSILLSNKADCVRCGKTTMCQAFRTEEIDMLVMGFPCTPFSALNFERFGDDYNPFMHRDAGPLFDLIQFLKKPKAFLPKKPKFVILENVKGLTQPLKAGPAVDAGFNTPLDYILKGTSCIKDAKTSKM